MSQQGETHKRRELVGQCPCDTCEFWNYCKQGHSCAAFALFTHRRNWRRANRIPTARSYRMQMEAV